MIAVLRIAGQVKKRTEIKETLARLNLPRKYSCIMIDEKDKVLMGMVKAVDAYVAFGKITNELADEMKKKRGKEGVKFFSLHPAVGGLKKSSKVAYPKGILGHNQEIGKLIERML